MPAHLAGDRRRLGHQLVGSVLAHVDQAVVEGGVDGVGPEVLGDGDEGDRFWVTAGARDPFPDLDEALVQSRHTTMACLDTSPRARQEK